MLTVIVLGPGCSNCERVAQIAKAVISEMALEATVEKVTDRSQFAPYGLLYTPGLVINGKLVCGGRVPTQAEVTSWMMTALEAA
jgi:small redox-active disulfide protein 2